MSISKYCRVIEPIQENDQLAISFFVQKIQYEYLIQGFLTKEKGRRLFCFLNFCLFKFGIAISRRFYIGWQFNTFLRSYFNQGILQSLLRYLIFQYFIPYLSREIKMSGTVIRFQFLYQTCNQYYGIRNFNIFNFIKVFNISIFYSLSFKRDQNERDCYSFLIFWFKLVINTIRNFDIFNFICWCLFQEWFNVVFLIRENNMEKKIEIIVFYQPLSGKSNNKLEESFRFIQNNDYVERKEEFQETYLRMPKMQVDSGSCVSCILRKLKTLKFYQRNPKYLDLIQLINIQKDKVVESVLFLQQFCQS
eukprot:TRINITY_DN3422_c0_g1_i5.p1 TRINITY_DN3422_c0_g1~~TRINITY_DN3422_c0_g1_i5.p1  ORF type:complete len:326 (-),score=-13.40 TRINITY_DN3422_c0_g1_i5:74-991(-)